MSIEITNGIERRAGLDPSPVEISYVLLGEMRENAWHARLQWKSTGTETSVLFDGARVMLREEQHGDVVGFFHTHPEGCILPSSRDDRTMLAWSFCFGKPLLCVIATTAGLRGWVYDYAREQPVELERVIRFRNRWLIGV